MSLEHELTSINTDRLLAVVDNFCHMSTERSELDEQSIDYLEEKYEALTTMIDALAERWDLDSHDRGLDPEFAVAMATGARAAALCIMSYSEADNLHALFKTKPENE